MCLRALARAKFGSQWAPQIPKFSLGRFQKSWGFTTAAARVITGRLKSKIGTSGF
jgi:hypothetical protein